MSTSLRSALACLSLLYLPSAAQPQGNDDALAVLQKAVKAHGGAAGLNRVRVARVVYTGHGGLPYLPGATHVDMTVEETYQMPRQVKKVIKGKAEGRDLVLAWAIDGDTTWEQDQHGKITVHKHEQANLEPLFRPYLNLEMLAAYERYQWSLRPGESQRHEDSVAVHADPNLPVSDFTFYFSKDTGLLTGISSRRDLPETSKEIFQEDEYTEYKNIDGVQLPIRQVIYHDGKKLFEIQITSVRFFDKLDDAEFAPPGSGILQLAGASLLGLACCFCVGWSLGKLQARKGFPPIRLAVTSAIPGGLAGFPVGLLVVFGLQSLGYPTAATPPYMVGLWMVFGGACAGFAGGWLSGRKSFAGSGLDSPPL
jgi:hypothetical protein